MSDVQGWDHVLKWGLAQNPELPDDPTSFSKENFNTLKNTLRPCIPYIKFYNLTSSEFSDKVLPYKKILPKELYEDLLKYFLNSNSYSIKKSEVRENEYYLKNIDSEIIISQHAELISKWIDKVDVNSNASTSLFSKLINNGTEDTTCKSNSLYEFKLLLRGSCDGFTPEKFHEICDNQSHTVIVTKVKDSNEILGGYNPVAWKSDGKFSITKDSFIFSFKNHDNIENHILNRNIDVILYTNDPNSGLLFGIGDLGLRNECGFSYCNEKFLRKS